MGEEQLGFGRAGEEVFLWREGPKRGRGYRVSCREEGAELPCHLSLITELEPEELFPCWAAL